LFDLVSSEVRFVFGVGCDEEVVDAGCGDSECGGVFLNVYTPIRFTTSVTEAGVGFMEVEIPLSTSLMKAV
jgi:hypothetical protein